MKKHDEGYTLPFVLVVFLIISLAATSILTISVGNLHNQKETIQRMESRYTAQGEIEKAEAALSSLVGYNELMDQYRLIISENILNSDVRHHVDGTVGSPEPVMAGEKIRALKITVTAERDAVQITAVLRVSGSEIDCDSHQTYTVVAPDITYESCVINSTGADGGAGE